MRITSVSYKNLQGLSRSHELRPCTIVAGPNFVGKTAIANAVRFALSGKLPELGGRNSDTFKLSSASRMEVSLKIDTGEATNRVHFITRSLTESRGSVKADGDPVEFSTPLLNFGEWFKMTTRERVDFVFRSVKMPEDKTVAGILATLERLSFGDEHSEAIEKAKGLTLAAVRKSLAKAEEPSELPDALLEAEISLAYEFTGWNGRAKDGEAAIRINTELKLREDECSAVTLTDLRNEKSRLEGLLGEANRELGALNSRQCGADAATKRRAEINRGLLEVAPVAETIPPFKSSANLAQVSESISILEKSISEIPQDSCTAFAEAHERLAALNASFAVCNAAIRDARQELESSKEELAELDGKECCPYCESRAKGWKTKVRGEWQKTVDQKEAELKTMESGREQVEKELAKAKARLGELIARANDRSNLKNNIAALHLRIQQNEREVAAYHSAVENLGSRNHSATVAYQQRMQSLRAEAGRMQELLPPTESEMQSARSTVETHRAALNVTGDRLRAAEKLQHDLQRAAQAAELAAEAAARRDVIKRVKEEITAIKGELVAVAFGTLLETANAIIGDVLRSPLVYHEESAQVGRWTPSGFVSHETFSGTEQVLCYMAVAAALSSGSKLRVMIVDELGRLSSDLRDRVLDNLAQCVRTGLLDQVIGIMPVDEAVDYAGDELADNWHIINLEAVA